VTGDDFTERREIAVDIADDAEDRFRGLDIHRLHGLHGFPWWSDHSIGSRDDSSHDLVEDWRSAGGP
jgi:hypothetical protein